MAGNQRTGSLFVAVVMYGSYSMATLFLLAPPTIGLPFLIYSGAFTAAIWLVVVVLARMVDLRYAPFGVRSRSPSRGES